LANVNAIPDWSQAATLAGDLWKRGGEAPVDGVISVAPGFLARVLTVIGPVQVPAFGETVTAANVAERFDFYTRAAEGPPAAEAGPRPPAPPGSSPASGAQPAVTPAPGNEVTRKAFVAELAQVVMQGLLAAPRSQWEPLAQAVGEAFDNRQAMMWSTDQQVTDALRQRRWDGTLPAVSGDFFCGAEFEYEAKHAQELRRTYDHHIELRADGSGRATTTITIDNPVPRSALNDKNVVYLTAYGPEGARLDPSSDPPVALEPKLAGHPGAGWFLGPGPLSRATVTVVWDVPKLAERRSDGSWDLTLRWMPVPDHLGDVLTLRVDLPAGWRWQGSPPPPSLSLDRELRAGWSVRP
jgi:hypothetical protein